MEIYIFLVEKQEKFRVSFFFKIAVALPFKNVTWANILLSSILQWLCCGAVRRVASQFFPVSPRDPFVCPVPSFSEMKELYEEKC